jgi:2-phospho-L-lactate/phosphoenolpyruvate guanylyltransferase
VRVIALPVTSLSEAKTRLEPVLNPLERAALTLAMLEDVMDSTLALPGWETWVISPDETVLEIALRRGAHALSEEKPPLSNAVVQLEEEAAARGADVLAILLADTPFVTPRALTRALHTLGPVVLAPSHDESGTNLLLRRPPGVIRARFGTDSYRKHLQLSAETGVPAAVIDTPELGFDLDLPGDILTVLEGNVQGRTLEVCREMDLGSRVTARAV